MSEEDASEQPGGASHKSIAVDRLVSASERLGRVCVGVGETRIPIAVGSVLHDLKIVRDMLEEMDE